MMMCTNLIAGMCPPCANSFVPLYADKVARLKQAKAEAEAEVEAYKTTREAQFQIFSKERLGNSGAHAKDLAKASEAELAGISAAVNANKGAVIDLLLKSVKTVA